MVRTLGRSRCGLVFALTLNACARHETTQLRKETTPSVAGAADAAMAVGGGQVTRSEEDLGDRARRRCGAGRRQQSSCVLLTQPRARVGGYPRLRCPRALPQRGLSAPAVWIAAAAFASRSPERRRGAAAAHRTVAPNSTNGARLQPIVATAKQRVSAGSVRPHSSRALAAVSTAASACRSGVRGSARTRGTDTRDRSWRAAHAASVPRAGPAPSFHECLEVLRLECPIARRAVLTHVPGCQRVVGLSGPIQCEIHPVQRDFGVFR